MIKTKTKKAKTELATFYPVDKARELYEKLSDREKLVFTLIVNGKTSPQVAEELGVSDKTVDVHRNHIRMKIHLKPAEFWKIYVPLFCLQA